MKRLLIVLPLMMLTEARAEIANPPGVDPPKVTPDSLVYPGCPPPPTSFAHVWYIDAVNGKTVADGADGSEAKPWNSLQAVGAGIAWQSLPPGYPKPLLKTVPISGGNAAAPISPGDEVLLMSGDYGNVSWGVNTNPNTATINPTALTIAAAPGETPVVKTLWLSGQTGFVFDGITVRSHIGDGNTYPLITVKDNQTGVVATNVVFNDMTIQSDSVANAYGWTQEDWRAKTRIGFSAGGGPMINCIALTNSNISVTRNGVALFAEKMLAANNEVHHFGDDGFVYGASMMAIVNNDIHDSLDVGDGNHEDGIQGQLGNAYPKPPEVAYHAMNTLLIDRNRITHRLDPKLKFMTYLQGITQFDDDWTNVTVTNNTVATSSCHGVEGMSIHNAIIANNSVIDGLIPEFEPGKCAPQIAVGTTSHQGLRSSDVRMFNNVGANFFTGGDRITVDHNVATTLHAPQFVYQKPDGAYVFDGAVKGKVAPSIQPSDNIKDGIGQHNEFTKTDTTNNQYDFTLKLTAPALYTGTSIGGPPTDNRGDRYFRNSGAISSPVQPSTGGPPGSQ